MISTDNDVLWLHVVPRAELEARFRPGLDDLDDGSSHMVATASQLSEFGDASLLDSAGLSVAVRLCLVHVPVAVAVSTVLWKSTLESPVVGGRRCVCRVTSLMVCARDGVT